jgi:hypothetical protein
MRMKKDILAVAGAVALFALMTAVYIGANAFMAGRWQPSVLPAGYDLKQAGDGTWSIDYWNADDGENQQCVPPNVVRIGQRDGIVFGQVVPVASGLFALPALPETQPASGYFVLDTRRHGRDVTAGATKEDWMKALAAAGIDDEPDLTDTAVFAEGAAGGK